MVFVVGMASSAVLHGVRIHPALPGRRLQSSQGTSRCSDEMVSHQWRKWCNICKMISRWSGWKFWNVYRMYLNMFESFWILNFPQFNWILHFVGIIVQIGCQIQSLGTQNKLCLSIIGQYESHRLWGNISLLFTSRSCICSSCFCWCCSAALYWRKSPVLVKQYSTTAPKKHLPRGPPWLSQA